MPTACTSHHPHTQGRRAAALLIEWGAYLVVWFYIVFKIGINYQWFQGHKVPFPKAQLVSFCRHAESVSAHTSRQVAEGATPPTLFGPLLFPFNTVSWRLFLITTFFSVVQNMPWCGAAIMYLASFLMMGCRLFLVFVYCKHLE